MSVRQESRRVNGRAAGEDVRRREARRCSSCGLDWYTYFYPKQPRPEYGVCSDCAHLQWKRENGGMLH